MNAPMGAAALRNEIDSVLSCLDAGEGHYQSSADGFGTSDVYGRAARLIRLLAADAQDAQRYRWLRENWDKMTGITWRAPIGQKLDAYVDEAAHALKAALDALAAPQSAPTAEPAPEGWQLVPTEPTDAMVVAAAKTPGMKAVDGMLATYQLRSSANKIDRWPGDDAPIVQAYRAMLAAAKAVQP